MFSGSQDAAVVPNLAACETAVGAEEASKAKARFRRDAANVPLADVSGAVARPAKASYHGRLICAKGSIETRHDIGAAVAVGRNRGT